MPKKSMYTSFNAGQIRKKTDVVILCRREPIDESLELYLPASIDGQDIVELIESGIVGKYRCGDTSLLLRVVRYPDAFSCSYHSITTFGNHLFVQLEG